MCNHTWFDKGTRGCRNDCHHQEVIVAHLIEMHNYLIPEELVKHHQTKNKYGNIHFLSPFRCWRTRYVNKLKYLFASNSRMSVSHKKKKKKTMVPIHLLAQFSLSDSLASLGMVSMLTRTRCFRWWGTGREETGAGDRVVRHAVKIE